MNLWPVEHFFPIFFQIRPDLEKSKEKSVQLVVDHGQRFLFTKVTSYKIHILVNFN